MDIRYAAIRPIRHMSLAFGMALIAGLYLVGPVAASQPYIQSFVDGPHIDDIDCGTFHATLVRNFTGTDMFFVDKQDDLIRAQTRAHMEGTLTSDTGTVVYLRGNILFVFNPAKGTFAFDGQVFIANRPGVGVVIHDTGRYLTDWDDNVLLDAGPHDVVDGDGSVFCTALL